MATDCSFTALFNKGDNNAGWLMDSLSRPEWWEMTSFLHCSHHITSRLGGFGVSTTSTAWGKKRVCVKPGLVGQGSTFGIAKSFGTREYLWDSEKFWDN